MYWTSIQCSFHERNVPDYFVKSRAFGFSRSTAMHGPAWGHNDQCACAQRSSTNMRQSTQEDRVSRIWTEWYTGSISILVPKCAKVAGGNLFLTGHRAYFGAVSCCKESPTWPERNATERRERSQILSHILPQVSHSWQMLRQENNHLLWFLFHTVGPSVASRAVITINFKEHLLHLIPWNRRSFLTNSLHGFSWYDFIRDAGSGSWIPSAFGSFLQHVVGSLEGVTRHQAERSVKGREMQVSAADVDQTCRTCRNSRLSCCS